MDVENNRKEQTATSKVLPLQNLVLPFGRKIEPVSIPRYHELSYNALEIDDYFKRRTDLGTASWSMTQTQGTAIWTSPIKTSTHLMSYIMNKLPFAAFNRALFYDMDLIIGIEKRQQLGQQGLAGWYLNPPYWDSDLLQVDLFGFHTMHNKFRKQMAITQGFIDPQSNETIEIRIPLYSYFSAYFSKLNTAAQSGLEWELPYLVLFVIVPLLSNTDADTVKFNTYFRFENIVRQALT